ncbi:MAG: hypothetical protein ACE5IR_22065, partial [bacterium]
VIISHDWLLAKVSRRAVVLRISVRKPSARRLREEVFKSRIFRVFGQLLYESMTLQYKINLSEERF